MRRHGQRHGARITGAELLLHHACIEAAASADLGDLLEQVHATGQ